MYFESSQRPEYHDTAPTPSFTETIQFYLLSIGLLIFFGSFLQHRHLLGGLFVSEILFIVAPSVSYTLQRHYNFSHTYSLFPITAKTAVLAGITALAAFVLVGIIAALQEVLIPRSADYLDAWEQILAEFHRVPMIVALIIVAVLPGVCEELLFRGFLLQGMRQRFSDRAAIIIVGVLFGVFHLDPYRFLPVTLLGILFGYMVVRTGSLVPGMVAHTINNSISILISYGVYQTQNPEMSSGVQTEQLTSQAIVSSLIMLAIALPVFVLSLRALPRVTSTGMAAEGDTIAPEISVGDDAEFDLPPDEEQRDRDDSDEENME